MYASRRRLLPLFASLSLALPACRGDQPTRDWPGTVDTLSSGALVVRNPTEPLWSSADAWRVEEVLRIGGEDGTGPDTFGSLGALAVDSARRIYVFDALAQHVQIFEADGRHLRTIGREGAGPGEFRSVIGMQFALDGTLWAVDAGNARYTTLANGDASTSFRRWAAMYKLPWIGGFDSEGRFYDRAITVVGGEQVDVVLRVEADGIAVDTFPLPTASLTTPRFGSMEFPLPFAPTLLLAWDPAPAVWAAVSSRYRISRIRLNGDTLLTLTRDVAGRALSALERDSIATYARNLEASFGVSVPSDALPSQIPPLRWFVVDDHDHLWVCSTGLDPCTELDVFDPSGRFLGSVTMPAALLDWPRPVIRGENFYAGVEGATGEHQLFVGRVVKP